MIMDENIMKGLTGVLDKIFKILSKITPELIKGVTELISSVAELLGLKDKDDSSEELGLKSEIADRKPEDFDSREEYISYLRDNIELNKYDREKLNDESLKEMKTILSKIRNKDFYAMISEIRQSEKNYEILLTNNVRIITETLVTEKKYDEAYKIYERIKKERPVTSMDLRFIDQTIVK